MSPLRDVARFGLTTVALALCAAATQCAVAQDPAEAVRARLRLHVTMHMGRTNLAAVLEKVSTQTGIPVRAESCLLNRVVVVEADDQPASALLADLAALEGWDLWVESDCAMLGRPNRPDAPRLAALPAAVRSALPSDFRAYLRVGAELAAHPLDPNVPPAPPDPDRLTRLQIASRAGMARERHRLLLARSVALAARGAAAIPYSALSQQQRTDLMAVIVCDLLSYVYSGANTGGHEILEGRLKPFQLDPGAAQLRLDHGVLLIGSPYVHGGTSFWTGFGAQVSNPGDAILDPLHLNGE